MQVGEHMPSSTPLLAVHPEVPADATISPSTGPGQEVDSANHAHGSALPRRSVAGSSAGWPHMTVRLRLPGDLLAMERKDVEAWLMAQRTAGLTQATMRNRWVALRNLYGWALAEEEIARNPLERVVVAKANTPAPDVLTEDELKLLMKACAGTDFYARRDLALIRFMVATGLRVSETVDLALGDLDLTHRIALVRHGKGDKPRAVRFDAGTAAALDRYKRIRARHAYASLPWLWIGSRGDPQGLGPEEFWHVIRRSPTDYTNGRRRVPASCRDATDSRRGAWAVATRTLSGRFSW